MGFHSVGTQLGDALGGFSSNTSQGPTIFPGKGLYINQGQQFQQFTFTGTTGTATTSVSNICEMRIEVPNSELVAFKEDDSAEGWLESRIEEVVKGL